MHIESQPEKRVIVGLVALGSEEVDAFLKRVTGQRFGEHQASEGGDAQSHQKQNDFTQHGQTNELLPLLSCRKIHCYSLQMFTPRALRISSIIALILSAIGLLLSLLLISQSGSFIMGTVSWGLLIWASYIGFQLSSYKLYEDEYKKVGLRIYAIIAAFIAFLTFGMIIGLILAVVLLSSLWGLKKNYDEWTNSPPAEEPTSEVI